MSPWRRAFDRIGGPDAVTWPAFWITFILSLFGHLAAGGAVTAPLGVRVLIVTVAQVAMFVPLVLLRFTLLRDPPRPRPWIAVAGFFAASVVRGAVLAGLLFASGAAPQPLWTYRIVASIVGVGLPLMVVALVVSAMRVHTRSLEALIGVQHELLQTQSRIVADVTQRNEEAIAEVQERLRAELASLDSVQGPETVAELQRLASDVVRPMSHELAQSLPSRDAPGLVVTKASVTWRQAVRQMIDRPPLQPWLAAGFMALILTNSALAVFGLARGLPVALTMFASIALLSIVANWILARLLPRLRPGVAPVAVVLASLAVGYLATAAASTFLPQSQNRITFILAGGAFPSIIVLLSALVTTILRQQRTTEAVLAESTERLRRQLVRLRQAQWLQQQSLSQALHGPIQAAVTSSALRLDAAVRAGDTSTALLKDTRQSLLATIDVLDVADTTDRSLALAFERITGTWEGVCQVTPCIDDCADSRLTDDPIAAAVIIDVITEAVSNAVRHGGSRNVEVLIACEDKDLITVMVRDDGQGPNTSSMLGLGTALLEECTLDWDRNITPTGCELKVTLPTSASV